MDGCHYANSELAKKIRKLYQQKKLVKKYQNVKKEGIIFDIDAIKKAIESGYYNVDSNEVASKILEEI